MRSKPMILILLLGIFVGCDGGSDLYENNSEGKEGEIVSSGKMKDLLIRPRVGIGDLRFGMTVEEMKELLGEPFDMPKTVGLNLSDDNYVYPELGIMVLVNDNVVNIIYCITHVMDNTSSVVVKPCIFRTAEGIGIGSTKSEILAAYGEPDRIAGGNQLYYKELEMLFALEFEDEVTEIMMQKRK